MVVAEGPLELIFVVDSMDDPAVPDLRVRLVPKTP
jgi:hypothetical protein